MTSTVSRPPSVDALARTMATASGLPHAVCVALARQAVADGTFATAPDQAADFARLLLGPVINATGVLLHTNLGRAPVEVHHPAAATNIEFDLVTGERGSRQSAVGRLLAMLCGAEAAMVVNNNAAAVLLVLAAIASGGEVLVSRGESVEIGGGFRVPEVMAQSGARLVDVGTTNRTRAGDYRAALTPHTAAILKVHPSNYRVEGFVEECAVSELAGFGVPVIADIGSGLVDATTPWLAGPPPAWLAGEPAARQTLEAGAALVTFSGDKLFGGPQAGVIAGRASLVQACLGHPLARAMRPGAHVLLALQSTALAYLDRRVTESIPFWRMASAPIEELQRRAATILAAAPRGEAVATEAVPGAGSAPGTTIPSAAIRVPGDHLATLRARRPPIVARVRDGATFIDLRTVDAAHDRDIVEALQRCSS